MFFKLERRWQILLVTIFLCLMASLYVLGILFDFQWFWLHMAYPPWIIVDTLFYMTTVLCFVFMILLFRGTTRDMLMTLAFFFILIADFFLVRHTFIASFHGVGVTAFLIAQIFFMRRLHLNMSRKLQIIDISARGILTIIGLAISIPLLWGQYTFLYFITVIYLVNLVMNVFWGWTSPRNILFALGLTFLLLCDIFVGLQHRGYAWFEIWIPFNFAWAFYVPAKAFLVLSLLYQHTTRESTPITNRTRNIQLPS
ncbi:MAG: hypothetical protein FWE31_04975 [Firmicutes bacterium]|nr:hypothetical protein [Bacillota bacterium]